MILYSAIKFHVRTALLSSNISNKFISNKNIFLFSFEFMNYFIYSMISSVTHWPVKCILLILCIVSFILLLISKFIL